MESKNDIQITTVDQNSTKDQYLHNNDNCNGNKVYYDDDDDYIPNNNIKHAKFYTQESLKNRMQKQIDETASNLIISNNFAYLLLKKFNWNEELIISKWCVKIERLSILKDLHVPETLIKDDLMVKNIGYGECPLCTESKIYLYQLYCGHFLCFNCWKNKIEAQLENIKVKKTPLHCMLDECGSEIMISDVKRFCGESKAKFYEEIMIQNQLFNGEKLIKCPAPNCPYFISIDSLSTRNAVTCKCGQKVFLHSHEDAHSALELEKMESILNQALKDQEEWIEREKKLAVYRFYHIDEVKNVYRQNIDQLFREQEAENEREINEIQRLEDMKEAKDKDNEYQTEIRKSVIEDYNNHIKQINNLMVYAYVYEGNRLRIQIIKSDEILRLEKLESEYENYKSDIARKREKINEMRSEISDIEKSINVEELRNRIETLNDKEEDILVKLNDLETEILELENNISNSERHIRKMIEKDLEREQLERIQLDIDRLEREKSENELDRDKEIDGLLYERDRLERKFIETLENLEIELDYVNSIEQNIEDLLYEISYRKEITKGLIKDRERLERKKSDRILNDNEIQLLNVLIKRVERLEKLEYERYLMVKKKYKEITGESDDIYNEEEENEEEENGDEEENDEEEKIEDRSFRPPPINYIMARKYNLLRDSLDNYN